MSFSEKEHEVVVETQEVIEHEEEVETEEITAEEAETETEQQNSPDEILPDVKTTKTATVPPLRPLAIAPKPAKVPLTVKPIGGQQLLLLQGGGSGQAIKLVSPQGQELANFQISRPVTLKPTIKPLTSQGGNISIVQQKPVVMKKILAPGQKTISKPITFSKQGQHFMVVQKTDQQQLKLLQTQGGSITVPSPTKTITLQQAQEMGLLSNAKIVPQGQSTKQTVLLSKNSQKTIKIVPQVTPAQIVTSVANTKTISLNAIKSPTKILPAASSTMTKGPQRIIFKTGSNQTILPSGQLIQVSGSQALNSGQLHQINIPGKGMQYIKFVTASTTETASSTASGTTVKTVSTAATANIIELKPVSTISKIAPKPLKPTIATNKINVTGTQMVVVPTNYSIPSHQPQVSKVAIPPNTVRHTPALKPPASGSETSSPVTPKEEVDANGMRPRKPCNCTKSQCLKLYCDCFANGEFCYMCNCMNCFNNLDNEDHRNRAIKACLERNPNAFRPKIGKAKDITGDMSIRKHTKGCNCKRSGCLKNYCECYEAKIACSNNCKCIGCRNIEDSMEKKNLRISNIEKATNTPILPDGKIIATKDFSQFRPRRTSSTRKQTISFITDDVIEATCQCMLTISDNAEEAMQDEEMTKRLIIEEFGRCLTEIIDCSSSRNLS
ncbi:protein lin-54 homolog isoform X2 [Anoplophora glabripennis]|uniref:protein lin-54 homolog isoform X2 n=1 Tax=Anoplophora glabripennis TaxID=217634 RepID=UPI000873FAED|nr:protein lin-54 homolog isoform X2 [Anoplophora glabripennis]